MEGDHTKRTLGAMLEFLLSEDIELGVVEVNSKLLLLCLTISPSKDV